MSSSFPRAGELQLPFLRGLHMEPDYHQLEFDLRLWLTAQELPKANSATR